MRNTRDKEIISDVTATLQVSEDDACRKQRDVGREQWKKWQNTEEAESWELIEGKGGGRNQHDSRVPAWAAGSPFMMLRAQGM